MFVDVWLLVHPLKHNNKLFNGVFLRVKIHSGFIWGVIYGPFGSGTRFNELKEMLEFFMAKESPNSDIFLRYVDKIARAHGWPCSTDRDRANIFYGLPTSEVFRKKGCSTKESNWFNWNFQCCEAIDCYWELAMVLERFFGMKAMPLFSAEDHDYNPAANAAAEFRAIRANNGGFPLARKCQTNPLYFRLHT